MLNYSVLGNPMGISVAVLPGIFGSGNNWRGFSQRLGEERSDLRFVLIDLRNHGLSPHFQENNTVLQSAIDVLDVQRVVGPFQAVIGHSFGGKVALQCADMPFHNEIEEVWALDPSPGTVIGDPQATKEVEQVFQALQKIQMPVARRSIVKEELLQSGLSLMISQWMTTNLKRLDGGYVWKFNLSGIQEMLSDYFQQDLWPILENPDHLTQAHIVRALKSDRWDEETIRRLNNLPERSTAHVLDAGHWLHVDNPTGLIKLLKRNLLRI